MESAHTSSFNATRSIRHGILVVASIGAVSQAMSMPVVLALVFALVLGAVPFSLSLTGKHVIANRIARGSTAGVLALVIGALIWVAYVTYQMYFVSRGNGRPQQPLATHLVLLVVALALVLEVQFHPRARPSTNDTYQMLVRTLGVPGIGLSFVAAIVSFAAYLVALCALLQRQIPWVAILSDKTLDRGPIPPVTIVLAFWAVFMLLGKFVALRRERGRLERSMHEEHSGREPESDLLRLLAFESAPQRGAQDSSTMDVAWQISSDSYVVVRYVAWAVPILGFIGTVWGIAEAVQNVRATMVSGKSASDLSASLANAIAPLAIAFDTTLVSLTLSVVMGLMLALVQRLESHLLSRVEVFTGSTKHAPLRSGIAPRPEAHAQQA